MNRLIFASSYRGRQQQFATHPSEPRAAASLVASLAAASAVVRAAFASAAVQRVDKALVWAILGGLPSSSDKRVWASSRLLQPRLLLRQHRQPQLPQHHARGRERPQPRRFASDCLKPRAPGRIAALAAPVPRSVWHYSWSFRRAFHEFQTALFRPCRVPSVLVFFLERLHGHAGIAAPWSGRAPLACCQDPPHVGGNCSRSPRGASGAQPAVVHCCSAAWLPIFETTGTSCATACSLRALPSSSRH